MIFQSRATPDTIIVSLHVDRLLYDSEIQDVSDRLGEFCLQAKSESKRLVVDLGDVTFMSSPLLGKLIVLQKLAKRDSVELRLAKVTRQCLELLTLLRLNDLFQFEDRGNDPDLQKPPSN